MKQKKILKKIAKHKKKLNKLRGKLDVEVKYIDKDFGKISFIPHYGVVYWE